jgi:FAD binding domain
MSTSTATGAAALTHLRSQLACRVLGPDDDGYDDARVVALGGLDPRPAVIVRPTTDTDVARTIALARNAGLPLAVRSGGHSGAAHSTVDGGIVLDLKDMKAIDVDVAGRTAWAEWGLSAAEFTACTRSIRSSAVSWCCRQRQRPSPQSVPHREEHREVGDHTVAEVVVADEVVQLTGGLGHRDHEAQVEEQLQHGRAAVLLVSATRDHRALPQLMRKSCGVPAHGRTLAK